MQCVTFKSRYLLHKLRNHSFILKRLFSELSSREVVGGGASGPLSGAEAPPILRDLLYRVPPGGQSLSSAGPTNNLPPPTSLARTIRFLITKYNQCMFLNVKLIDGVYCSSKTRKRSRFGRNQLTSTIYVCYLFSRCLNIN